VIFNVSARDSGLYVCVAQNSAGTALRQITLQVLGTVLSLTASIVVRCIYLSRIFCMLPVAVARSSSDGAAIRYTIRVLRTTSCFYTVRPMGRIEHDVTFRRSSPGGGTSWTTDGYSFWSSSSQCGTGDEVCIPSTLFLWSLGHATALT